MMMIMMTTRFNDLRLRLWPFRAKQRIVIFFIGSPLLAGRDPESVCSDWRPV